MLMEADTLGLKPSVDLFLMVVPKTQKTCWPQSQHIQTHPYIICTYVQSLMRPKGPQWKASAKHFRQQVQLWNFLFGWRMIFYTSFCDLACPMGRYKSCFNDVENMLYLCMPKGPQVRFSSWHSTQSAFLFCLSATAIVSVRLRVSAKCVSSTIPSTLCSCHLSLGICSSPCARKSVCRPASPRVQLACKTSDMVLLESSKEVKTWGGPPGHLLTALRSFMKNNTNPRT